MGKSKKKDFVGCKSWAENLPLTRFVHVMDGRKWESVASRRYDFFIQFAGKANADGTFVADDKNFSPSERRVTRHHSRRFFYRYTKDLNELGLLTWSRAEKHYGRRVYEIPEARTGARYVGFSCEEQVSDSKILPEKQVPDTSGTGAGLESGEAEQVPDSQITGATGVTYPSTCPPEALEPTVLPTSAVAPDACSAVADAQEGRQVGEAPEPESKAAGLEALCVQMKRFWGDTLPDMPLTWDNKADEIIAAMFNEHGADKVEEWFREWLPSRNVVGLHFPISRFAAELEVVRGSIHGKKEYANKIAAQEAWSPTEEEYAASEGMTLEEWRERNRQAEAGEAEDDDGKYFQSTSA
jgi:hypothetical protein